MKGSKLDRDLDELVRQIYPLKYPNPYCFVCKQYKGWFHPKTNPKGCQIGHYISRAYHATSWYFPNIFPQCLTKQSKLRMFSGLYTSVKDVKIGNKLWGFNENTLKREVSTIEDKKSFIPRELYRVELENGEFFECTGDHRVFTNKGWVEIKDMLHDVTAYDILEL